MKLCTSHWIDLKEAISSRGLYQFVSPSGEVVVQKLTDGGFDPLMGANMAIMSAAVTDAGIKIMIGDKCPLCEVGKQDANLAKEWINGASDDQLEEARKRGLLKSN